MITENLSILKIHKLTQEQYDRELAAGNVDETALYLTPDDTYSKSEVDAKFQNVATKEYVDTQVGDIETALDELHIYAQSLVSGGATE